MGLMYSSLSVETCGTARHAVNRVPAPGFAGGLWLAADGNRFSNYCDGDSDPNQRSENDDPDTP